MLPLTHTEESFYSEGQAWFLNINYIDMYKLIVLRLGSYH